MQFFKHLTYIFSLIASLMIVAKGAYASNLHLILGADYVYSDIKYDTPSVRNRTAHTMPNEPATKFNNFSPVIGLSAYGIGLEAFILGSGSEEKNSLESKMRAYGIDFVGEASLSDNFTFVASLGIAQYKFENKDKKEHRSYDDDSTGPRVGVGLQYYLTRNIAVRAMYHYTLLNSGKHGNYDAVSEFSGGLRFIF